MRLLYMPVSKLSSLLAVTSYLVGCVLLVYLSVPASVDVLLFPTFLLGGCLVHLFLVTLCKWIVIGKFKEGKAIF